jgi:hydrogenase maturation protease
MADTVIIGYGSTLRSDDGIGYLAAERLMELLGEDQAEVLARQQLTPDLADVLRRYRRVIFIDACADAAAGQIDRRPVVPDAQNWGAFVHEMSPAVLLGCVKETYGQCPTGILYAIGVESFAIGEGLSPMAATSLDRAIQLIRAELATDNTTPAH